MPVLSVTRDRLLHLVGNNVSYSDDDLDALCANMGLELDEVTSERERKRAEFLSSAKKGIDKKELEKKLAAFSDAKMYKVDIPANRWDLLCAEGFASAVRVFNNFDRASQLSLSDPKLTMHVSPTVAAVRPFVVCAVLRGISLDDAAVASFIDHQERLHGNVCKKRRLVSVGTHRLKGLTPPFTYKALTNAEAANLTFTPLNQSEPTTVAALGDYIRGKESMRHLVDYLPAPAADDNTPHHLVIMDAAGVVMSVPPIINGDFSKVVTTPSDKVHDGSRDILIEATCEDVARAHVVVAQLVTAFSRYCDAPHTVEPVTVLYDEGHSGRDAVVQSASAAHAVARVGGVAVATDDAASAAVEAEQMGRLITVSPGAAAAYGGAKEGVDVCPNVAPRVLTVAADWISDVVGVKVSAEQQVTALRRLAVDAMVSTATAGEGVVGLVPEVAVGGEVVLRVAVPCTRPDVLHAVDLVEDVAIGFGYDKVAAAATVPTQKGGGRQQPLNHLADLVRQEIAACGWVEALTFSLMSVKSATYNMRWSGALSDAVTGAGGCSVQASALPMMEGFVPPVLTSGKEPFAAVRTSLLPALLLALNANKAQPLPQRMFEVSDVVLRDASNPNGASNSRRVAACYTAPGGAGYEFIKGLVDVVLAKLCFAQRTATGSEAALELEGRDSVGGLVPSPAIGVKPPKGAPAVTFVADDTNPAFFPKRAVRILRLGVPVGWVGVLHPEVCCAGEVRTLLEDAVVR